jgi:hypothetical protein
MLTGRSPFARGSLPQACAAVLEEPVQRPRELRPELPGQLEAIVLGCLEKDVERRPQSVVELAHALAAFAPRKGQRHARRCQQILEEHGLWRSSGVHALESAVEDVTPVLLTRLKLVPPLEVVRESRRYWGALRKLAVLGLVGFGCFVSLRASPKRVVKPVAALNGELCEMPSEQVLPERMESRFVWDEELAIPAIHVEQESASELRRATRRERRERAREEARLRALAERAAPVVRDTSLGELDRGL